MKRLIDSPTTDPMVARAQSLVRAMGETQESEERMRRVRRSIESEHIPRSPRWTPRFVLATALLAASAAAAVGTAVAPPLLQLREPAPRSIESVPPPPARFDGTTALDPAPQSAPEPRVQPETESTATGLLPPPSSPPAAPNVKRPAKSTAHSDVALVHEAAKAMRRDGDPARALQLLNRSKAGSFGPLKEEALALRIEASMALADGRATRAAASYLRQYPNGRYRQLAKKALVGP